jgi:restriction endonuclease Mrr
MTSLTDDDLRDRVAEALGVLGYAEVRHEESAVPFRPDLVATDNVGRRVVVRVNRQGLDGEIDIDDLRRFLDEKNTRNRLDRGVHVTTGRYTTEAIRLARQHDLTLVDGDDLATVLSGRE